MFQVQEFEAQFAELPPGKPVQSRFMRSQQELKAKLEEQTAAAESGEAGAEVEGNIRYSCTTVPRPLPQRQIIKI